MHSTEKPKISSTDIKRLFQQIAPNDPSSLAKFLDAVSQITPSPVNFKLVKSVIVNSGFPGLIFLEHFFQGLSPNDRQDNQELLQELALIAYEMAQRTAIPELDFIFRVGIAQKEYKTVIKTDKAKQFIERVRKLSELKSKKIQHQIESLMEVAHRQYSGDLFYLASFDEYLKKKVVQPKQEQEQHKVEEANPKQEDLKDKTLQANEIMEDLKKAEESFFNQESISLDTTNLYSSQSYRQMYGEKQKAQTKDSFSGLSIETDSISLESTLLYLNERQICCREYFFKQEDLKENEDDRISFLNISYPFQSKELTVIKQIICSFLNQEGGHLFIGIEKDRSGRRIVSGFEYTENQKQNVLRSFRQITQQIEPDILTHKMYSVDFVPIKQKPENDVYLPGMYVLKVSVRFGLRDQIYSYRDYNRDYFPFRNHNEIIYKQGRSLLNTLKERIKNPPPIPVPRHQGTCLRPHLGNQIHEGYETIDKRPWRKEQVVYMPKPFYPAPPETVPFARSSSPELRYTKPLAQKEEPKPTKFYQGDVKVQEPPVPKKEPPGPPEGYFFVVGVNEKQLSSVLEKKGLLSSVKIESSKTGNLVAKANDPSVIPLLRKYMLKLGEKYVDRGIKIYEITLEMEVGSIVKAHTILSRINSKFEIRNNKIIFQYYRDSLQGLIMLQPEMQVRFIHPTA